MLINLAVTENFVNKVKVPTLPRPLIGTVICFIMAAIIAIKFYKPSSVSLKKPMMQH